MPGPLDLTNEKISFTFDRLIQTDGAGNFFNGLGDPVAIGGGSGTSGTSGTSGNGTSGTSGVDGTSGTSGIDGTSGTSGASGTSGTSGIGTSGTSGIDGTSGTSGIDGTSGTSGVAGTSGTSGIDGTSGTSGISGTDGTSGTSGIDGSSGTSGVNGAPGAPGTSGTSGTSGVNGAPGAPGAPGTSGTSGTDGSVLKAVNSGWWSYNGPSAPSNPGSAFWAADSGNLGSISVVSIASSDLYVSYAGWFSTLDYLINTEGRIVYFQIEQLDDPTVFSIYSITAFTNSGSYSDASLSHISGSGTLTSKKPYSLSWIYNGLDGAAGAPGTSGTSGVDGTSGTSGASGTSGTSGASGATGTSGTSGTSPTTINSFGIAIDGQGGTITTGVKGYVSIPYNCTITGWTILANTSGSIVVDVWKAASAIPTVANTIAGTEKPTLSSAQINSDNNLTTWTTAVSANDVIGFNVDSATTVANVTLTIAVTKN